MRKGQKTKTGRIPITRAIRNAVWVYSRIVPSRFPGGQAIVEQKRSHEQPRFSELPEGSDVSVELYGNALCLRLDALSKRIYTDRFEFVSFPTEEEAKGAFASLWKKIQYLDTIEDIRETTEEWRAAILGDKSDRSQSDIART